MKTMPTAEAHQWVFKSRFRRHAFGWKSQPAITRVKQAVAEIKQVGKTKPILAAEGAILFFERVSPALEQVDSSSGSMGRAGDGRQRTKGRGAVLRGILPESLGERPRSRLNLRRDPLVIGHD
jgi:hypothetical protein